MKYDCERAVFPSEVLGFHEELKGISKVFY